MQTYKSIRVLNTINYNQGLLSIVGFYFSKINLFSEPYNPDYS